MSAAAASDTWYCHAVTPTGQECKRGHPPNIFSWRLWCPYHYELRADHIEKDLCPMIHRDRRWCMNPRNPNYEHCVTCHLKQVEEQKRKEQEAERQRQREEERQRQQAEHVALESQP